MSFHRQVHSAVQQIGFRREKRGFQSLRVENLVPNLPPTKQQNDPTDPYFPYQWYLVSTQLVRYRHTKNM